MKNSNFKRTFLFCVSLFIAIVGLPLALVKGKLHSEMKLPLAKEPKPMADSFPAVTTSGMQDSALSLYNGLHLDVMGLSQQTFEYALRGFNYLLQTGKLMHTNIISIVDFSLPSSKKRLFVIDLYKHTLEFCTYVAHGANSGLATANQFSNQPECHKSSLGFYETLNTYNGGNGYSLRLEGLEPGINDNALERAIVMHGAAYVNEDLIQARGYIGRSWGCPAVSEKMSKPIIDKIRNGSCLFIYSPDKNYLNSSKILNAAA